MELAVDSNWLDCSLVERARALILSSTKKRKQRMDKGVRKQKKFITGLAVEARRERGEGRRHEDGGGRKGCSRKKDRTRGAIRGEGFRHGQPPSYFVLLLF